MPHKTFIGSGGFIENFEMNVNTSMTTVTGRVIGSQKLKLGYPSGKTISMTLAPEKCHWNLVGSSLVEGKPVECWCILDFTLRSDCTFRGHVFISKLIDKYRNMDIDMNEPVWIEKTEMRKRGNYNSLCEKTEKINGGVHRKCRRPLQFLFV